MGARDVQLHALQKEHLLLLSKMQVKRLTHRRPNKVDVGFAWTRRHYREQQMESGVATGAMLQTQCAQTQM